MNLLDQIEKKRKEIKTDGYPMSIGEWISMYERNELDIHPEFQRFFRWSSEQKTALIESLLLGIPLPPIFVGQRRDGVWDVIDGVQRLSTILEFIGILRDEKGVLLPPLRLDGTKYLPALDGVEWDHSNQSLALPRELQLVIKRSKIAASIVLKESDESAKYDLFQRLNTGGSQLSPQEVRNCLLVMVNREWFEWLRELPTNQTFITATALSDRPLEESYDVELALRFVVLSQIDESDIKSVGDVGLFLTDKMTAAASDDQFDRGNRRKLFIDTFALIDNALGDDAFKRFNAIKKRHEGGFLLSLFETVALGVAYNVANGTVCTPAQLDQRAKSLWNIPAFTQWAASGMTASRRLPRLIPFGRKLFDVNYQP